MDVAKIKDEIWAALKNPSISTIGLVGRWGVGKTHLWKSLVEEHQTEIAEKYSRCAYVDVSLFGIRSISDVKSSILFDAFKKETKKGEFASMGRLGERLRATGWWPGKVAAEAIGLAIDVWEFGSIRKCLVCLDDLERVARELDIDEIMGLVETLARERACKVVLIFSRDNRSDPNKLKQYRDKVFDKEILLDPPIEYAINIAAAGCDASTMALLSKVAGLLHIKNIRVLKKIRIAYDESPPYDFFGHEFATMSRTRSVRDEAKDR